MSYWYCCKYIDRFQPRLAVNNNMITLGSCGQGGYYGALAGSCMNCGHIQCSCCNVETHNDSSASGLAYNSHAISAVPTVTSQTTCALSTHRHDNAPTFYSHPRHHPPGQTAYYWTCCNCGNDVNNVDLHAGCTDGCGHWRDASCAVRCVTLPQGRSMAEGTGV